MAGLLTVPASEDVGGVPAGGAGPLGVRHGAVARPATAGVPRVRGGRRRVLRRRADPRRLMDRYTASEGHTNLLCTKAGLVVIRAAHPRRPLTIGPARPRLTGTVC